MRYNLQEAASAAAAANVSTKLSILVQPSYAIAPVRATANGRSQIAMNL